MKAEYWGAVLFVAAALTALGPLGTAVAVGGDDFAEADGLKNIVGFLQETYATKSMSPRELKEKLASMGTNQVTRCIASCLTNENRRAEAIQALSDGVVPHDESLAAALAACIKDTTGKTLLRAVRLSKNYGWTDDLEEALWSALKCDYVEEIRLLTDEGQEQFYRSVFVEASEALFQLTGGKLGQERFSRERPISIEEKQQFLGVWGEIRKKNKAQSASPRALP